MQIWNRHIFKEEKKGAFCEWEEKEARETESGGQWCFPVMDGRLWVCRTAPSLVWKRRTWTSWPAAGHYVFVASTSQMSGLAEFLQIDLGQKKKKKKPSLRVSSCRLRWVTTFRLTCRVGGFFSFFLIYTSNKDMTP